MHDWQDTLFPNLTEEARRNLTSGNVRSFLIDREGAIAKTARAEGYAQGRHDMRLHCASLDLRQPRWSCLNPNDKRVATESYGKACQDYRAALREGEPPGEAGEETPE